MVSIYQALSVNIFRFVFNNLYESAIFFSMNFSVEDCPFVAMILDKILEDFIMVYRYLRQKIEPLIDSIKVAEPPVAILIYEYYCELLYVTKLFKKILTVRKKECKVDIGFLYVHNEEAHISLEKYIASIRAELVMPMKLNLHLLLNDEAKVYKLRFDSMRLMSRSRPALAQNPTLIDLLEYLKGYQSKLSEEKLIKGSPIMKPELGQDSFTRSKRQSNYLAEPQDEQVASQQLMISQNSLRVPERFSFQPKNYTRSRSNMVQDSQEFFRPKLSIAHPKKPAFNMQLQSQTSQAIDEQEDSDSEIEPKEEEKKPVSAHKVTGRKLVFKKDQLSQAH